MIKTADISASFSLWLGGNVGSFRKKLFLLKDQHAASLPIIRVYIFVVSEFKCIQDRMRLQILIILLLLGMAVNLIKTKKLVPLHLLYLLVADQHVYDE